MSYNESWNAGNLFRSIQQHCQGILTVSAKDWGTSQEKSIRIEDTLPGNGGWWWLESFGKWVNWYYAPIMVITKLLGCCWDRNRHCQRCIQNFKSKWCSKRLTMYFHFMGYRLADFHCHLFASFDHHLCETSCGSDWGAWELIFNAKQMRDNELYDLYLRGRKTIFHVYP